MKLISFFVTDMLIQCFVFYDPILHKA